MYSCLCVCEYVDIFIFMHTCICSECVCVCVCAFVRARVFSPAGWSAKHLCTGSCPCTRFDTPLGWCACVCEGVRVRVSVCRYERERPSEREAEGS